MNDNRILAQFVSSMTIGVCAAFAGADEIDDIIAKIDEAHAGMSSIVSNVRMSDRFVSEAGTNESESTGTLEYARSGGKTLYRLEMEQVVPDGRGEKVFKGVTVCDGVQTSVYKDHAENRVLSFRGADEPDERLRFPLQRFREDFNVVLVARPTLNNRPTYLLEISPKDAERAGDTLRLHIDQETGLTVKCSANSNEGTSMSTLELTNIRVNVPIAADRFTFEPPPNTTVIGAPSGTTEPTLRPTEG